MVAPVLVQSETCCPKGQTHPRLSECDCGQVVSARPHNSDGMVYSSGGIQPPVSTWHCPQVDMFLTRYSCRLTKFLSPVPDPNAWEVDALTVSWENLDMYAFPPVSLLGKVVSKLSDHLNKRVILIAPGWPNMPWFWDLVDLSSQILLCLPNHPNRVTSTFMHGKGSLARWRYELRLLKDVQPEQFMRQSGPFLLDGVKQVRWTSSLHLSKK